MTILTVTGHRPDKLGGYSIDVQRKLVELAASELQRIKPSLVITGMALGWDQAVAEASAILGIPFHAYIPFKNFERMWPRAATENYRCLVSLASRIVVCCDERKFRQSYGIALMMQSRNIQMVDVCDTILALWDGSRGGTNNCLRYAKKKQKPVENCWERWSEG